MDAPLTITPSEAPAARKTDFVSVLIAPAVALIHPRRAAEELARGTFAQVAGTYVLYLLLGVAIYAGLAAYAETNSLRDIFDVVALWYIRGWPTPVEYLLAAGFIGGLALGGVVAAANLPLTHRAGSVVASLWRAFAAAGTLLAALPLAIAALPFWHWLMHELFPSPFQFRELHFAMVMGFISGGWLLWIALASGRAARAAHAPPASGPRCESCGYNLTACAPQSLCPECGTCVDLSLAESRRRETAWAERPTLATALSTFFFVLLRPRAFYSQLATRRPDGRDWGLCYFNHLTLGIGAGLWFLGMSGAVRSISGGGPTWAEVLMIIVVLVCAVPVLCHVGYRAIAMLVSWFWLRRGDLPDFRIAARIVAYESVFLWAFCLVWAAMISTLILTITVVDRWFPRVRANRWDDYFLLYVLAVTLVVGAVWLWRYEIAYRAVRWANY